MRSHPTACKFWHSCILLNEEPPFFNRKAGIAYLAFVCFDHLVRNLSSHLPVLDNSFTTLASDKVDKHPSDVCDAHEADHVDPHTSDLPSRGHHRLDMAGRILVSSEEVERGERKR